MVDTSSGMPLGSVEVEVKANLDKLTADFARGKAQAQAFSRDMNAATGPGILNLTKNMEAVSGQSQKFMGNMVTVNRWIKEVDANNQHAAQTWTNVSDVMKANAAAINAVQRATNPAVASQRLVTAAVRDAEKAYRDGTITSGALARAQQIAAPYIRNTAAEYENLARKFDPLRAAQAKYSGDLALITQAETAGIASTAEANVMRAAAAASFSKLTTETEKSSGGLSGWARSTEHHLRAMRLLLSFVGVDIAARLGEFAVKTLEATAAIKGQADQLGLTMTQLQEYNGVATQVGMTSKDMQSAFASLGEKIDQIALGKKNSEAAKTFKALGVAIDDASGKVRSRDSIFKDLIDRFGQVQDKAQRAGAMAIVFGEAASKMGELVDQGSDGIERLKQAVKDTGGVLSDEQIQKADQTAKKLGELWSVLKVKFASTVVENADAIYTLADAFAHLASNLIKNASEQIRIFTQDLRQLKMAWEDFQEGMAHTGNVLAAAGYAAYKEEVGINSTSHGVQLPNGDVVVDRGTSNVIKLSPTPNVPTAKPKGPNIDLSGILSPKERTKRDKQPKFDTFDEDMAREKQQQLQLERNETTNIIVQDRIDKELADLKLQQQIQQIKRQQHGGELTAGEAKQLIAQAKITTDMEKEEADHKLRLATIEQAAQFADEIARLQEDGLNTAKSLARTDTERKTIDAAILDSKQQQAIQEIQKEITIARENKDEQRVLELTEEMVKLRSNQVEEWKDFDIQHLTGIQKFANDLPKTSAEFNDQIHNMAFDQFNQKLAQAGQFAGDLGDDFGKAAAALAQFQSPLKVFQGLISDLAATFTKNFIEKPVSDFVKDHLGVPLAKQAFGGQLDKLAKEAGGTALTTNQMNTALATATQSLYALTHAAEAASSAVGAKGVAGGAGAAMDFSSVLAGSTGTFSASDLNGLNSGTLGRFPLKIPDFGFAAPTSAKDHPAAHDGEVQFDRSLKALARSSDETASSTDKTTTALNSATPSVDRLAGAADRAAEALSRVSASGGGGGGGAGGFSGSSIAGLFGGGGSASLGSLFSAAGGFGDAFSSIGAFSAGDLGSLAGSLGDFPLAFGFGGGGYTGSGSDSDPAGIVHANEFVVHADAVRKIGLPFLHSLNGGVGSQAKKPDDGRLPGYAVGGFVGTEPLLPSAIFRSGSDPVATAPTPAPATGHVTVTGPGQATGPASLNDAAAMLMQAAQMLMQVAQAQGGGGKGGGLGGLLSMGIGLLAGGVFGGGGKNAGGLLGALLGGGGKTAGFNLGGMSLGGGLFSGATLGGLGGTLGGVPLSIPGFDGGGFTGSGPRNQIKGFAHAGEYIWDADTTRQWLPALQMISARRIPGFTGPGPGSPFGGSRAGDTNHFNLGGVHIQGANDERSARRSGRQALGEIQRGIASAARKGMIHRSNP